MGSIVVLAKLLLPTSYKLFIIVIIMEGKPLASNGNKPGSNGGGGHETKSQKAWQLRLKAVD